MRAGYEPQFPYTHVEQQPSAGRLLGQHPGHLGVGRLCQRAGARRHLGIHQHRDRAPSQSLSVRSRRPTDTSQHRSRPTEPGGRPVSSGARQRRPPGHSQLRAPVSNDPPDTARIRRTGHRANRIGQQRPESIGHCRTGQSCCQTESDSRWTPLHGSRGGGGGAEVRQVSLVRGGTEPDRT